MDYNVQFLTKNDCFKDAKQMSPSGIVVHSTGANNPNLKRYIQPDDGRLGKGGSNHWNKSGIEKCTHAFIGKDKDGKVCTYQTLPLNICAWACGKGSKGSYNYSPAYLHFEICEDDLTDGTYFDAVMKEAQELCAKWCKELNISVEKIVSHAEAHAQGYASNHSDIGHWLKRFGKDMNWFRAEVQSILDADTSVKEKESEENEKEMLRARVKEALVDLSKALSSLAELL